MDYVGVAAFIEGAGKCPRIGTGKRIGGS